MKCEKCGKCCKLHPCAPLPSEVDKIAEYLKILTDDFVRTYLIWDFWLSDQNEFHWYKVFRRDNDKNKIECEFLWPFKTDPCLLLDENNLCKIHSVKPLQASSSFCKGGTNKISKEILCKAWEKTKYFEQDRKILEGV